MKNISRKTLWVAVMLVVSLVSCDGILKTRYPLENDTGNERYEVQVEYKDESYIEKNIINVESYPLFSEVLLDKGYIPSPKDAAHFKAIDSQTGEVTRITMIPCSNDYDGGRIAVIYYLDNGDDVMVTSAEYFEDEEYEISHPIDQEVLEFASEDALLLDKLPKIRYSASKASEYWGCVAKRFAAGCLGCALKCYISGPAWGSCTSACCAGAVIVGMVSCYFEVAGE